RAFYERGNMKRFIIDVGVVFGVVLSLRAILGAVCGLVRLSVAECFCILLVVVFVLGTLRVIKKF
ncbi:MULTISPECIES: hypothetical protein, partial [unclassified Helicobacter]|uniref:hypothetical protein n=1 Tax=unclassified Helicobacter TaxID=2593540 RepID=UPI001C69F576